MIKREVAGAQLPWCAAHGTGVICYSPMQSGILTDTFSAARVAAFAPDDWRRRGPEFKSPQLERNLALRDALKPIAARHRHDGRRGRDRLGARVAGSHRRDRRRPFCRAGRRLAAGCISDAQR